MEEPNRVIEVEDPLHIPAIVYSLEEKSKTTNKPFYTLLEHREEPCIIRGVGQALIGSFDSQRGYHLVRGIPEIKRQDGGNSWYHGPTTCLIKTMPFNKSKTQNKADYDNWHHELSDFYYYFSGFDVVKISPNSADLYSQNDLMTQLFGTSAYNNLFRACWYEDTSKKDEILDLVRQDPQMTNINNFERALGFAQLGFKENLFHSLNFEGSIGSRNFISNQSLEKALSLQQKQGVLIGPCISGKYPLKASEDQLESMRLKSRNV